MAKPIIAIDAMSGDLGPRIVVPATLRMLANYRGEAAFILVGDQKLLRRALRLHRIAECDDLQIHHASEVVEMDELPSVALRTMKDSSMRVALNLVRDGVAQACVSAGNTGALMATARFVLKTLPGIDRPAIIHKFPNMDNPDKGTRVLDLGANVDTSAERLFQFAVMGSALTSAMDDIARPSIGLMNIGEEEIKGNEQVRQTSELLNKCTAINYYGYVEGDDIFKDTVDVIVCDGFTGNVALKASEGSAKLIYNFVKQGFVRNIFTKISGLIASPVLRDIGKRIDPARYNGASFLGLRGIVIKSHGNTSIIGFSNAIKEAIREVEKDVPSRIKYQVQLVLQECKE